MSLGVLAGFYFVIGVLNVLQHASRGGLSVQRCRTENSAVVEAWFYLFLWPIQVLFGLLLVIHAAIEWLLGKFMA